MPATATDPVGAPQSSVQFDPHRYREIDTIRGIIIILVLLGSFGTRYESTIGHLGLPPAIGYPVVGYLAVQLFFCVSAYRRMIDLVGARSLWHYASICALRYLPALWPSVVIGWVLVTWVPALSPAPASALPANLLMVADLFGAPLVDPTHWRLKIELLLLSGAGIMWFVLGSRYLAICLAGLLFLVAASANWLEPVRQTGIGNPLGVLTLDGYLPHCIFGVALWQLVIHGRPGKSEAVLDRLSRFGWVMLAACGCALAVMGNKPEHRPVVYLAFVILIGAVCGGLPSLSRIPLLQWLGRISMPIYLVHLIPGFISIGTLERLGCPPLVAIIAASVLSIALGAMLERWVERPVLRFVARRNAAIAFKSKAVEAPDEAMALATT